MNLINFGDWISCSSRSSEACLVYERRHAAVTALWEEMEMSIKDARRRSQQNVRNCTFVGVSGILNIFSKGIYQAMSQNEKFTFPNSSLIHGAIIKAPPLSALSFHSRKPASSSNTGGRELLRMSKSWLRSAIQTGSSLLLESFSRFTLFGDPQSGDFGKDSVPNHSGQRRAVSQFHYSL